MFSAFCHMMPPARGAPVGCLLFPNRDLPKKFRWNQKPTSKFPLFRYELYEDTERPVALEKNLSLKAA